MPTRFTTPPPEVSWEDVDTVLGTFLVAGEGRTLVAVRLPDTWSKDDVTPRWSYEPGALRPVSDQLHEYFDGSRTDFELELAPQGTPFQRSVWAALCDVPFGQTTSYGDVAAAIGNPKAVRAVGMANNRNPIALVIPCHRVIGADGSLTGYGGGLEMKSWLLDHERRTPEAPTRR